MAKKELSAPTKRQPMTKAQRVEFEQLKAQISSYEQKIALLSNRKDFYNNHDLMSTTNFLQNRLLGCWNRLTFLADPDTSDIK